MDGPIISFDVSKGESHMRAYEANGKPFGKVLKIRHDKEGFGQIRDLYEKLKEKTGRVPSVVFESTGVYTAPLLSFFLANGYTIYQISPLESAKERKANIRPTKNDSLDTGNIAMVFYKGNRKRPLIPYRPQERVYEDLKEMSRQYQFELCASVVEMNRYHRCLDAVWPLFDEIMDYSSENSLSIVIHYGHPSAIKSTRGIMSVIKENGTGKSGSRKALAEKVLEYSKNHISGTFPDSYLVKETVGMARALRDALNRKDATMAEMKGLASTLPEFLVLCSLPAVADTSAVRLLAEIGSINRFPSVDSFVAYAGLDPNVNASGTNPGLHLSITKKGNRWLRTTLYLIVGNICRFYPESKIAEFVMKKKNGGLCYKAAKVAGSAKLARIIYSMLSNGTCYSEE